MRRHAPILLLVVVAGMVGGAVYGRPGPDAPPGGATVSAGAYFALWPAEARASGRSLLEADQRAAGLRFGPGVDAAWRQAVLASIARARPEAARLIALVDGLVEIRVAGTGPAALGTTTDRGGAYTVLLDLPRVLRSYGERGIDRVVLHELGHVLDAAVVSEELDAALDAQIPAGYGCPPGARTSACAPRAERFAETFAKWATDDIGVNLEVGYAVAPPVLPLAQWGEPLAALTRDQGQ